MTRSSKTEKPYKSIIDCAFGEKCARRKCSFKHPENRNVIANERKAQQRRLENSAFLRRQQELRLDTPCRNDEICRQLKCPYRHSQGWDPKLNQQSYEEKRRREEQRNEEQRKHALDVSIKVMTEEEEEDDDDLNNNPAQETSPDEDFINEEYDYDEEYFVIQDKVWEKQSDRNPY